MHIVDWDSYIVRRGDLIQYLIGHVDIDADLAAKEVIMTCDHGRRILGP